MNNIERFSSLPVATWPRLRALIDHRKTKSTDIIDMTIGSPRHDMPPFVKDVLLAHLDEFRGYPNNNGTPALLDAISKWIAGRYDVQMGHDNLLALNGTREGLYFAAAALSPTLKAGQTPVVLSPNPFYPAYSAAAASIGADALFVPAAQDTGFLPDYSALSSDVLNRTSLAYICAPSNPQGAMADLAYWRELITLAERYDFKILADECYSEIYRDAPPVGVLQAVQDMGADPERVIAFHSLSKRSNLAGLRSGFCAGGPKTIAKMRQLRAYGGAPLSGPLQAVAAAAWSDETHVQQNRALYKEKFEIADRILSDIPSYTSPQAGFFLWIGVENGEEATVKIWEETGVRVLPGAYIARDYAKSGSSGQNPGQKFIRVALVESADEVERGLRALKTCLLK